MEPRTIIDALADAAINTIATYEDHVNNGRFSQAHECLTTVETITYQVQRIELNDKNMETSFPKANLGYVSEVIT